MPNEKRTETVQPLLGPEVLEGDEAAVFRRDSLLPVRVLQIGEGNFLRGFVDWILHQANRQGLFNGSVAVTQPRPSGKPRLDQLKKQDGLYTLLVRGLERGEPTEKRETVSVISQMIDPYEEWETFLALAENPHLEFVVSNTTEAGLAYQPSEWTPGGPVASFPGKLTVFLYHRFLFFEGDPSKGLIHLPCELLDRNGERLLDIVLRHADDWGLPDPFKKWVMDSNRFLNTLVDRIVTGFPEDEADDLFSKWGYSDPLLTTADPYYLWAIQGEPSLENRLPLRKAGLNVHWVNDLARFQIPKVRILNGAHTMISSIGLLHGLKEVKEAIEHPVWGPKFESAIFDEIVFTVPLDGEEMKQYAFQTLERFRNPYIRHRLSDIALNSLSKWKVRLLPSLKAYVERTGKLPPMITESLASALIWETGSGGELSREEAVLALLQEERLWGQNLRAIPGLAEVIVKHFTDWEERS